MSSPGLRKELPNWAIPTLYAFTATVAAMIVPRVEARFFPGTNSGISPSAALAICTSIGSGMLALTGIVFSLFFVMIQFSAMAYSPRLVSWIARDRVIWHSLGIFVATFLYSIAALAWLDRNQSGNVPLVSGWLVIGLLLASVGMLIALVKRISVLQVSRMLLFAGERGREAIERTYPSSAPETGALGADECRTLPVVQTLSHSGRPRAIELIDQAALLSLALRAQGMIEVVVAVGDTVVEGTPLLRVRGAGEQIAAADLRKAFQMGEERTFEQDPKYAIRMLVDIAVRALSPAVNDPTTAVQALDQIEDLLLRLGWRQLQVGSIRDAEGALRVIIPGPTWDDFVALGFAEIRRYGASSLQVMRRMKALTSDLTCALPEPRHAALRYQQERLDAAIGRSFADAQDQRQASMEDRQGLGVTRAGPRE
jgi:uncharacterized membrane protein